MTLRAILLCHGHLFSVAQWSVILRHVILPAIQSVVEFDTSSIVNIMRESPSVSSVEFLWRTFATPIKSRGQKASKFCCTREHRRKGGGESFSRMGHFQIKRKEF